MVGDLKSCQYGRDPVSYHRDYLESYGPNVTSYLPDDIRAHLRNIGTLKEPRQSAGGTYAEQDR